MPFSVVVICKNAEATIGLLLDSVQGLTDDVVVCDTGSTDNTVTVADGRCRLFQVPWEGYGASKNYADTLAKYDWILSMDADEVLDKDLYAALQQWTPGPDHTVYQVLRKNFFAGQWIRYGGWQRDWKGRLFKKTVARWNLSRAHEDLESDHLLQFRRLDGYLEHYSFAHSGEYFQKIKDYAMLMAEEYSAKGKTVFGPLIFLRSFYGFIRNYFLRGGFLDGWRGLVIARSHAFYIFMKYTRLKELNDEKKGRQKKSA